MGCLGALIGIILGTIGSVLGIVFGVFGSIFRLFFGALSGVFFGLPVLLVGAIVWFLVIIFRKSDEKVTSEREQSPEVSIDVDEWEDIKDDQKN